MHRIFFARFLSMVKWIFKFEKKKNIDVLIRVWENYFIFLSIFNFVYGTSLIFMLSQSKKYCCYWYDDTMKSHSLIACNFVMLIKLRFHSACIYLTTDNCGFVWLGFNQTKLIIAKPTKKKKKKEQTTLFLLYYVMQNYVRIKVMKESAWRSTKRLSFSFDATKCQQKRKIRGKAYTKRNMQRRKRKEKFDKRVEWKKRALECTSEESNVMLQKSKQKREKEMNFQVRIVRPNEWMFPWFCLKFFHRVKLWPVWKNSTHSFNKLPPLKNDTIAEK